MYKNTPVSFRTGRSVHSDKHIVCFYTIVMDVCYVDGLKEISYEEGRRYGVQEVFKELCVYVCGGGTTDGISRKDDSH